MFIGLIPFIVGFLGIVGYSVFRFYEAHRGERFFEPSRKRLDSFSIELHRLAVFGELPSAYRISFRKLLHAAVHAVVSRAVKLLRAVERPLSRFSYRLHITRIHETERSNPSPFIKKIVDAKTDRGEKPPDSVESD